MNNGNNGMFEPQIMPNGNNNNNGNNFNPSNNGVNPDELRSLDQQMGNMPGPNEGFNDMNNQNNFNNNNMQNNMNPTGFNDMNNQNNFNNNNMQNNMNPMDFNNMNNQNNFNNNMNPMGNNMNNQGNYAPYNAPMQQGGSNNGVLYAVIGVVALIAIGLVVYFVFLSGNKKVLSCELKSTGDETRVEIIYKNDKVSKGTYYEKVDGSSFTDEEFEQIKNYDLCTQMNSSMNGALKNCKKKIEGKNIIIDSDLDVSKSTAEDNNIETVKKTFESVGMTCTIK